MSIFARRCAPCSSRGFARSWPATARKRSTSCGRRKCTCCCSTCICPRLTGLETMRKVKQLQVAPAVHSAFGRHRRNARAAGSSGRGLQVLAKPVTRRELTSTVDAAMRRIYGWTARATTDRGDLDRGPFRRAAWSHLVLAGCVHSQFAGRELALRQATADALSAIGSAFWESTRPSSPAAGMLLDRG